MREEPLKTPHPNATTESQRHLVWSAASCSVLLWFVANRCLVPMDETDLFYNVRLGDIIRQTHHVPLNNLLSFTNATYPDPNLAWLFQVVLSLVFEHAGIPGTVILKTLFVLATFGVLFRVAIRRGAEPVLAATVLALAAWAAEPRFVERPHLVTFVGLAVLLLAMDRSESNRPGLLWGMVPLGWVWANGNSCFFLSPTLLILYALGAFFDGHRLFARRALIVATLQIPLLFATPSGVGWWHYVVNHFRMPYVRPLQEYRVAEWPLDGPFFFLLAAAVLCALPHPHAQERSQLLHKTQRARFVIPWVALAALGSRRIRFVAEFAIVAGPWIAAEGSAHVRAALSSRRFRLGKKSSSTRFPAFPMALRGSALATLAAIAVVPRLSAISRGEPFLDLSMEAGLVPEAAIAWVNEHHLRDHLYNDLEVGSYLAWEGWPQHRVFQDPRINGYPEDWHAQLRRADLPTDEWESLLARHNVDAALITFPGMNPRGAHFDPKRWALVYDTPDARVFVRRVPTPRDTQAMQDRRDLIERNELPFTFTFSAAAGVERVVLREPPVLAPTPIAAACHWADRLAQFDLEQGDFAKAAVEFEQALSFPESCLSGPSSVSSRTTRERIREQAGTLALKLGHPQQAAMWLEGLTTPTAMINLGYALIQTDRRNASDADRTGGLARALSSFRSALAIERDNPEANFGEALSLARMGRHDEAAPHLRDFLEKWPKHFAAPQARNLLRDKN